jgi:hypothetical protein
MKKKRKKISCVVGYNRKKFVCHTEIVLRCIPQREKSSSVVSHNKKNLFRCIPQRQKDVKLKKFSAKRF